MSDMDVDEDVELTSDHKSLIDYVFSWSITDILNQDLYNDKVKRIPETFLSVASYMKSFHFPLIEETRADLCSSMDTISSAPTSEILSIEKMHFKSPENLCKIEMRRGDVENGVGAYGPETGDIFALTDVRPSCIGDLNRCRGSYLIVLVQGIMPKNESVIVEVLSAKPILLEQYMNRNVKKDDRLAVFLVNMMTHIRIWKSLNGELEGRNMEIIKKILQPVSSVILAIQNLHLSDI